MGKRYAEEDGLSARVPGVKLLRNLHLENWGGRILLSAGLSFWEVLPPASSVPPGLLSPSCWEFL